MSWTLRLFACELEDVVSKCRTSQSLPDEVLHHVKANSDADADDLQILREILCSGLTGNWPDDETTDSFSALCWLLEVIAENVTPPELVEFRSFGLMEETGLLRHFRQRPEIVPLPTSRIAVGRAGILKNENMNAVLEAESAASPMHDPYVRRFHTYLLDTIEFIAGEGKDLVLVMFC